jgi:hypothetical protein
MDGHQSEAEAGPNQRALTRDALLAAVLDARAVGICRGDCRACGATKDTSATSCLDGWLATRRRPAVPWRGWSVRLHSESESSLLPQQTI